MTKIYTAPFATKPTPLTATEIATRRCYRFTVTYTTKNNQTPQTAVFEEKCANSGDAPIVAMLAAFYPDWLVADIARCQTVPGHLRRMKYRPNGSRRPK